MCAAVQNVIYFGDHQQNAQDLIALAEESEVSNTESKCNAEGKAPLCSGDRRFLFDSYCGLYRLECRVKSNLSVVCQRSPPE